MNRVRISTTVDATTWKAARCLLSGSNSEVVEAALLALIENLEAEKERAALAAHPYGEDPDLAWVAPPGPPLPYDASVPDEILRLAEQRRVTHPQQ